MKRSHLSSDAFFLKKNCFAKKTKKLKEKKSVVNTDKQNRSKRYCLPDSPNEQHENCLNCEQVSSGTDGYRAINERLVSENEMRDAKMSSTSEKHKHRNHWFSIDSNYDSRNNTNETMANRERKVCCVVVCSE
jgi:hypothetical protein